MNMERIKQFAWIGDEYLCGEIKAVVLAFHGLGYSGMKNGPDTVELEWARAGCLVVFPYYGPWSWMNREARAFVDELVEAIYENYSLGREIPLISTGGSMGGLSALLYSRYSKMPVAACLALYPVCDTEYHMNERIDLPRTMHHAFRGYKEDMDKMLVEHSPLKQVEQMRGIPYLIIHGDKDLAVNKEMHSDRMVAKMREKGLAVEYVEVPEMGHGEAVPVKVLLRMIDFVKAQI